MSGAGEMDPHSRNGGGCVCVMKGHSTIDGAGDELHAQLLAIVQVAIGDF